MRTREAATELVTRWYEAWTGVTRRPTPRELRQAAELVLAHGYEVLVDALPLVIETLKVEWPECMRFGGSDLYWGRAVKELKDRQRDAEQRRQRQERQQQQRLEFLRDRENRPEYDPEKHSIVRRLSNTFGMPGGCVS
jgi:hypothetical protein